MVKRLRYFHVKKRSAIIITAILILAAAIGILIFAMASSPKRGAEEYIIAMQKRDFDAIYELNYEAQKKVQLILRESTERHEEQLKANYLAEKDAFEKIKPDADISSHWSERFLFIPEMKYTIIKEEEEVERTPSTPFRPRRTVSVYVKIEYANKASAPLIPQGFNADMEKKKIKTAAYQIKMVQSEEVIKGIRPEKVERKWLFKGTNIIEAAPF